MCESGNKQRQMTGCSEWVKWFRCFLPCLSLYLGLFLGLTSAELSAAQLDEHRVEDLDYGSALYQFFQEDELSAITHLMVAAERPRSRNQINEANLLLADLYYGYGLYEESRQMFARLLTAEVSDSIQDRVWFNLARLRFEQGHREHARELLSRISNRLPGNIESERKYLLTNLYLDNAEYGKAADISNQIDSDSIWKKYARYNLGAAMIEGDRYEQGKYILNAIGQNTSLASEQIALRDQANLSLGLRHLRMDLPDQALKTLTRIRLQGPLSNDALLASGWAWYHQEKFKLALVPWRILLRKNAVDAATQEAILAIPVNYARAGQDSLAIKHYEIAARQFEAQLQVLDNAVDSINNDGLIAALREHAILFDRSSLQRLPPSSDVTPQLHLLLASTGFQREIKRFQELLNIRTSLQYWGSSFPTLELMLAERRQGFKQKLPLLERSTSFDRLDQLKDKRQHFSQRVAEIDLSQDFQALATPVEIDHLARLQRVRQSIERVSTDRNTAYQQDMHRLLSGILDYELETDFPARFWAAKKQSILLDRALNEADQRVESLVQISNRTSLEFEEFQARIDGKIDRINNLRTGVSRLLSRQEIRINQMAIESIRQQQKHIVQLRLNARFELAKLYDKLAAPQ
jgi:hypothetical protein